MNPHELSTDQLEAIAAEAVDPNANGIPLTSPEVVEPRTPQDAAGLVECEKGFDGEVWVASWRMLSCCRATRLDARRSLDLSMNRLLADMLNAIGENKAAIYQLEQGESK